MIKCKRACQSINQSTSQSINRLCFLYNHSAYSIYSNLFFHYIIYTYMYLYMYTAACSVKGRPQERAGAVKTFLKTFVSDFLSLSVVWRKCLPPKSCSFSCSSCSCLVLSWLVVLFQNVGNFFHTFTQYSWSNSIVCSSVLSLSLSIIHSLTRALTYVTCCSFSQFL